MTYDEIAKKLFGVMEEMRCLVILDDIWSIETWNLLKVAFPNVETEAQYPTRHQAVASLPNRNVFSTNSSHSMRMRVGTYLRRKQYLKGLISQAT
ncbi:putative disease resistance protein [Prunus yedoensis var. nudiflora]|uniref:Putative disease resistance protein n=1 Tax=Prunus yedoensis var. nudiflora TaxID=2094558 RepID=A0A314UEC5_PRUYE|nr:putative disease resistance protein [Prunus yedoensis var. nudiflora]